MKKGCGKGKKKDDVFIILHVEQGKSHNAAEGLIDQAPKKKSEEFCGGPAECTGKIEKREGLLLDEYWGKSSRKEEKEGLIKIPSRWNGEGIDRQEGGGEKKGEGPEGEKQSPHPL